MPQDRIYDGIDLFPIISGQKQDIERPIFYYRYLRQNTPSNADRADKNVKLCVNMTFENYRKLNKTYLMASQIFLNQMYSHNTHSNGSFCFIWNFFMRIK